MAYIGQSPSVGEFRKLDDISGSFDGSQTSFALTVGSAAITPGNNQSLLISLNGIIQEPGAAYNISGTNIVFTEAPAGGSTFYGVQLGTIGQIGTPSDDTVSTAKLQANAVTSAKIAASAVGETQLATNSISAVKIQNSAVTGDKLDIDAVTTTKMVNGAVTSLKLGDNAVTTSKIADANVTIAKLNIDTDLNFAAANIYNSGLKAENVISTSNVTTLNYANATVFTCTATEQSNITLSNFPQEGIALLKLRNGGAFTIAYAGNAYFATGTAPTLTSAGLDYLYFQGNALGYLVTSVLDVQED